MLTIDIQTVRRFILGKQGLWPGRRWGIDGTEQAMREMQFLQLDPLRVIARSQDIALHSRVIDYKPEQWERPTYNERKFFDWGGWLAVRPMAELPHWRVVMRRERDHDRRLQKMATQHADAIAEMRQLLRERDTVTNRDFRMAERTRTDDYRGRKDSAVALYYLWRVGEVMTYRRDNFERVYALTEAVAPAHLMYESDEAEADRYLINKRVDFYGLLPVTHSHWSVRNKHHIEALLTEGGIVKVKVEGWRGFHYMNASDVPLLSELSTGRIPATWAPLDTTTNDEALFLAPLDPVSARGRAARLFDFDYVWEVYKPAAKRRFGYYTLPVLWGDRLVARFDSKLDRTTNTFVILGFWLEDDALAHDAAFAEALARGFASFVTFLGAKRLDAAAIPKKLRPGVE